LNLVALAGRELYPLYNLDSLAILREYFGQNLRAFKIAAKIVIAQAILEADGDIFLNSLAAKFDAGNLRALLKCMIEEKHRSIERVVKSPAVLTKIYSIIDIRSQTGSKPGGQDLDDHWGRRTEPLGSFRRTSSLSEIYDKEVIIPDDYLRKVPVTRKGWAQDLGLFSDGELTLSGEALLRALDAELHLRIGKSCFVFWPYPRALAALRMSPETMGAHLVSPWNILCTIASSLTGSILQEYDSNKDYYEDIQKLEWMQRIYRETNAGRGAIRHQIPLYVVEPCLVGLNAAESGVIPPLSQIVDSEAKKKNRRVERVVIRGTDGGLVFPEVKW
jgi:hypothetical protein